MTRRSTRILGIVAAGALALTACASQGDTSDEATGGETDATTAPERTGGIVTVAETNAFTSFNPSESSANMDINSKVVGMMRSDFIYIDNELNIVPDTSFGTVEKLSDEPLSVKYTINDTSVWSDGNAIDKGDMLLNWAILSGHFNGPANDEGVPEPSFFAPAGSTAGLENTDMPAFEGDRTMTLTYSEPFVDWEIKYSMAGPPAHVVADRAGMTEEELITLLETATPGEENEQLAAVAEVWNKAFNVKEMPTGEDVDLLLSSGPMIVTDFVPEQSITLKVNENYGGDLKANVDEITVRFIGDAAAAIAALRNGEVDIIAPQPSVDTIEEVKGIDGVTVLEGPQLSYDHVDLRFGVPESPMADADVRKAFLMTLPREAILDRLIRTMTPDAPVVNSQIFVPTDGDAYTSSAAQNGTDAFAQQDIEGAKALLAGKTPEIRIMYNNGNPNRVDSFAMIQEAATQAGFKVIDNGLPPAEWGAALVNPENDVTIFGWISPGVGNESIPQIFKTGGGGNYNGYSNAQVDTLADELMVTVDPARAQEIKEEVDSLLIADNYGLPLFQGPGLVAHSDSIGGIEYMPNQTGVWWNFWEWTVNS